MLFYRLYYWWGNEEQFRDRYGCNIFSFDPRYYFLNLFTDLFFLNKIYSITSVVWQKCQMVSLKMSNKKLILCVWAYLTWIQFWLILPLEKLPYPLVAVQISFGQCYVSPLYLNCLTIQTCVFNTKRDITEEIITLLPYKYCLNICFTKVYYYS